MTTLKPKQRMRNRVQVKCGHCTKRVVGKDYGELGERFRSHLRGCSIFRRAFLSVKEEAKNMSDAIEYVCAAMGLKAPEATVTSEWIEVAANTIEIEGS